MNSIIIEFVIFVLTFFCHLKYTNAFVDLSYFRSMMSHLVEARGVPCAKGQVLLPCDENQLMLQLARLYVTSPERVVLLVTTDPLENQCQDIAQVMQDIKKTLSHCIPISCDNLYMRLYASLKHFNSKICPADGRCKMPKSIMRYRNCLPELHEEFLDCEGKADWFEKTNRTVVCKIYNEILDCYYIKAANLCGMKPARFLRSLAKQVIEKVIPSMCRVSRSPPIKDPMPFSGCYKATKICDNILILIIIYFVVFYA